MGSSFKRNKIINGDMRVDQRFAGAAWGTSVNGYTVDRWSVYQSVTGKINGSQNYNSVTPPTGFTNYIGVQSQSAYTVLSGDYYGIRQIIEGYQISDLAWGTANAKSVTLSFWAYSSLTGNFGAVLQNNVNATYPFLYNIPVANTWTYITVNIPGPTIGTWLTTTGWGVGVTFSLGSGSTYQGTANSWSSGNYNGTTGQIQVVGTNAATLYITGVQLEVGSVATPYERQIYSDQLAQCQRYYYRNSANSSSTSADMGTLAYANGATTGFFHHFYKVTMRTNPTFSFSGTFQLTDAISSNFAITNMTIGNFTDQMTRINVTVASGLTTRAMYFAQSNATATSYIDFSAEL
jgi:hypothetical protein